MATTRILAAGLSHFKQPRVIAEVLGGIILGPSVLGYIPGWLDHLFPKKSLPFLTLVANVGLILYMFLVGLELDPVRLFSNAKHTIAISVIGIICPFVLGSFGAIYLYQNQTKNPEHLVPFPSFLLFTGLAMSITAFPVLARILTDLNLTETEVGIMTIGSAAIDDAVAWCLLILVISILNSADLVTALYVFFLVAGYGAILLVLCRPYISCYLDRVSRFESDTWQKTVLAFTFMAIFCSAFFTEIAGVHTIFGAFLLGLAVPSNNPSALRLAKTIEDFASIVLLPLYFAASGLRTQIASLNSGTAVLSLFLVLAISTVGKLLGCALAARAVKIPWREAFTIGTLMNTRGLVELIVLNLGLDAKVIDVELFTTMVLMALITTFATSPIVAIIYPPHRRRYGLKGGPMIPTGPPELAAVMAARAPSLPGEMKLMLVAQRTTDVPGLALLTELIMPGRLSAVRFVDSNESSIAMIMAQGTAAATKLDPTLQMVTTCGYLTGIPVEAHLKVCKAEDFAKELCHRVCEEECDMVLLTCRKQVPSMPFIHDYHQKFVSEVIDQCSKTLLLFWDQQLGDQFLVHRAIGGKKRIVVIFQGGNNDREALRLGRRFIKNTDEVFLEVFALEQSELMTLRDQAELVHIETSLGEICPTRFMVHRVDDPHISIATVVESCKAASPHLILLGSSEAASTATTEGIREKRASVTRGTEMNFRKRQLLGKLGQALSESAIEASLLVVIAATPHGYPAAARGAQKSGLDDLGVFMDDDDDDDNYPARGLEMKEMNTDDTYSHSYEEDGDVT